jgi:hypothetical protein
VQDRNTSINESSVHRVEVFDFESEMSVCGVIPIAPRKDREMKVTALAPRVFVMATADPRIARPAIVSRLKRNPDQISIELGGAFQIRSPQEDKLESAADG